jgi:hypothetical protein
MDADVGFQVAAEGIIRVPSGAIPGAITRPCSLKTVSASAAAAAIAFARSSLNCLRSARRLAVISSDVSPVPIESYNFRSRTKERHTLALHFSRIYLSRQPTGLTPGEISFSKEPALP